jgi:hypothetical protein
VQHIFKCALDNWLYCFISTQTAYAVWFCWINSVHTPTTLISFCNFPTHSHLMLDVTLSAIDRYHPWWQGWVALKHRFSSTPLLWVWRRLISIATSFQTAQINLFVFDEIPLDNKIFFCSNTTFFFVSVYILITMDQIIKCCIEKEFTVNYECASKL